ncbi:MAG: hypothetical protein O7B99_00895, partial [Planctomycetota bacterium]|nr:hypothetical protein [Planctomycetota bacterium]
MRARVTASLALAGLVLPACGGGEEPEAAAAVRLTLERADDAEPAPDEDVITSFGVEGWTISADSATTAPDESL